MNLLIDTTVSANTHIGLLDDMYNFFAEDSWPSLQNQSEELLAHIDALIREAGLLKHEIRKVIIIKGPGSYTGLRIGLATGNALALAWKISAIGLLKGEFEARVDISRIDKFEPIQAFYQHPPHITQSKRHGHRDPYRIK